MLAQRRIVFLFFLLCLSGLTAWGQGSALSGQVFTPNGYPAASVPVRVCAYTSTGIPCTPLSSIYSDITLTTSIGNPYTTDSNGNFAFYVGLGTYVVQITVGTVTYSQLFTANGNASVSSVSLSMPGIFTVSGSPVTTSGTFTVTFASQSANLAFLSPNGSSGTPTFRSIVKLDLPFTYSGNTSQLATVSGTLTNNSLLAADASGNIVNASGSTLSTITISTSLILSYIGSGQCLQTTTGGAVVGTGVPCGTVTSVGLTGPNIFTYSNTPVTSSGTLTMTLATQGANAAFMSPNGSIGVPSFRSIVVADLPFTYTGNTTKLATASGSFTAGDFLTTDASGNVIDSGFGNIKILAKITKQSSCQLASDPNGFWSCSGSFTWSTTLSDANYNLTCSMQYPGAGSWPSGTYGTSKAAQGTWYSLTQSTTGFTYLISDDHSGSNGAIYAMDCMAYE